MHQASIKKECKHLAYSRFLKIHMFPDISLNWYLVFSYATEMRLIDYILHMQLVLTFCIPIYLMNVDHDTLLFLFFCFVFQMSF